jgi:DNA-directed RNA polymerase subunit N (RpoN/RPB10)
MFERVICNCGKMLSNLTVIYREALQHKTEILGIDKLDSNMTGVIDISSITSGDILDQLGVFSECCRCRIMSNVKFFPMLGISSNPVSNNKKETIVDHMS